jgi:phosphopantothenoylcysteine synthetase/decarboxylase
MTLECENLLIGATGSIGVVNMPQYIHKFRQAFANNVTVLMSRSAQKFIPPYTMGLFSGNPVFTDTFDVAGDIQVPHIELARKADLFLIMPATANIFGKAAAGICDDLISTTIVACQAPIAFVPSMNQVLWSDKVVQRNVSTLKELGYYVIEPTYGVEVSGLEKTLGAMPPFDALLLSLKMIVSAGVE